MVLSPEHGLVDELTSEDQRRGGCLSGAGRS